MASTNYRSGTRSAQTQEPKKTYRLKLSKGKQWAISAAMMVILFAIYFDLCLMFTKYNLFNLGMGVKTALLFCLVLLLFLLGLIIALYGDWKRPACAFLACLALYLPLNYSRLPKIEYLRKWYIQTAYSTMRHQGLMHVYLPWVSEREVNAYKSVLTQQVGVNTEDDFDQNGDDWMNQLDQDQELQTKLEQEDPGFKDLPADQKYFYSLFYELDRSSAEAYLAEHPEALERGYEHIFINKTSLSNPGTGIKTKLGEEVLAIDTDNGILILEMRIYDERSGTHSRGVLAIAKNPKKLHLISATTLPDIGQTVGTIAGNNGGILAMTGSSFIDEGGVGLGGEIAGFARCGGVDRGTHMGWGSKRLELHDNGWFYIEDAPTECSPYATDAMEFQPALVINGERMSVGEWYDTNPRACIGQSARGEILMLTVEGRRTDSPGCSLNECIDVLLEHDCTTALNCDGGTTAILWYRGEPIMRCSNSAIPQGRYLPNAWVIVGD